VDVDYYVHGKHKIYLKEMNSMSEQALKNPKNDKNPTGEKRLEGITAKSLVLGLVFLILAITQGLFSYPAGIIIGLSGNNDVSVVGLATVVIALALNVLFGKIILKYSERAVLYIITLSI
jgi:hypothetical protein